MLRQQSPLALFQCDDLVGLQVLKTLFSSTRPEDFDTLDFRSGPDPEMQAQVVLRDVTAAAAHFIYLLQISSYYGDAGANAVAVRFFPDGFDQNPILPLAIILQQARRIVHIIHDNFEAAVIVKVSDG